VFKDAGKMASSDDGRKYEEEKELERKLQALRERKKSVLVRTKEADIELWEIGEETMAVKEKLQQIRAEKVKIEQMRYELESVKIDNVALKELQENSDRKIESLETQLSCMKKNVAVCEREHERAGDVNVMKKELESLRRQNVEQIAFLRQLKDTMQRVTNFSKTQQTKKEQALMRRVASLEDEIAAQRQISAETQQRQLNEIQLTSTAMERKPQHLIGKGKELKIILTIKCKR